MAEGEINFIILDKYTVMITDARNCCNYTNSRELLIKSSLADLQQTDPQVRAL